MSKTSIYHLIPLELQALKEYLEDGENEEPYNNLKHQMHVHSFSSIRKMENCTWWSIIAP
jgi:hypothetical protein